MRAQVNFSVWQQNVCSSVSAGSCVLKRVRNHPLCKGSVTFQRSPAEPAEWVSVSLYDGISVFDMDFQWMCGGGGWRFWPLWFSPTCPLSLLALVPSPSTPMCPQPRRQWDLLGEKEEVGCTSFMTSLPFFSSSTPFDFQSLSHPRESGATIYIVVWELRPRGPFCCEVGCGSGGWGRGRGAEEGCPLFQPAEWASVPTELGGRGEAPAPAAWQRWGNVYRAACPHVCIYRACNLRKNMDKHGSTSVHLWCGIRRPVAIIFDWEDSVSGVIVTWA